MSGDGQQKLGKYTLLRKLAQGGMAEIFLANQEGPQGFQKQLVIKRILPHLADDTKFVEMFLDEARIAAQFNHPNIVQIFDLGKVESHYFIAMEFIDGHDLSDIIERAAHFGKRVPSPIAARIIADSLAGLSYAHEFKDPNSGESLNIVHRDISPQNLLVNKDGVVKLVDFGVAKAKTSSAKTQTGAVKGKFSYMAPEQIAGETLDGRSDVFAMGIVLYELLLGVRPFGEHSDLMAITAIVHQPPKNPREIDESFPEDLERILEAALAKNRDERYASAHDMQRDLEMFLQRSGAFITSREVAKYIQGIFSDDPPDLDSIGLGASSTHAYSLAELQNSTDAPAADSAGITQSSTTTSSTSVGDEKPAGTGGLKIAIAILAILILGGGGYLAWMLTQSDGDGSAEETTETAVAESAGDEDVVDPPESDVTEASGAGATGTKSVAANGETSAVDAADAPQDVVAAAATDSTVKTEADLSSENDAGLIGEPEDVTIAKADISHIDPESLPGAPADVAAGFGVIRLTSNLSAKVSPGQVRIGKRPKSLSLKAGEHKLTFESTDKKARAKKTVEITVFDGRRYDLEVPFEKGTLELKIEPEAEYKVKIDGNSVGKTPLDGIELWEGSHEIQVTKPDGKRKSYSLTVRPGSNPRTIRIR